MIKVEVITTLNGDFQKGETRVISERDAKTLSNQGFVRLLGEATPEDVKADEEAQEKKAREALKADRIELPKAGEPK